MSNGRRPLVEPEPVNRTIFDRVRELNFPLGEYVVVGGAMEAHGIRRANDVDIIASDRLFEGLVEAGWIPHTLNPGDVGHDGRKRKVNRGDVDVLTEFSWKDTTIAKTPELIAAAEIIKGLPFVPLEMLLRWKEISEREKDAQDAKLIRDHLAWLRGRHS